MLRCNKYPYNPQGESMDWNSLMERLQEMFPNQYKSDVELYIESKNPKNAADVEHWLQQYTYHDQKNWLPNA
jgi:hypothetical protein